MRDVTEGNRAPPGKHGRGSGPAARRHGPRGFLSPRGSRLRPRSAVRGGSAAIFVRGRRRRARREAPPGPAPPRPGGGPPTHLRGGQRAPPRRRAATATAERRRRAAALRIRVAYEEDAVGHLRGGRQLRPSSVVVAPPVPVPSRRRQRQRSGRVGPGLEGRRKLRQSRRRGGAVVAAALPVAARRRRHGAVALRAGHAGAVPRQHPEPRVPGPRRQGALGGLELLRPPPRLRLLRQNRQRLPAREGPAGEFLRRPFGTGSRGTPRMANRTGTRAPREPLGWEW